MFLMDFNLLEWDFVKKVNGMGCLLLPSSGEVITIFDCCYELFIWAFSNFFRSLLLVDREICGA